MDFEKFFNEAKRLFDQEQSYYILPNGELAFDDNPKPGLSPFRQKEEFNQAWAIWGGKRRVIAVEIKGRTIVSAWDYSEESAKYLFAVNFAALPSSYVALEWIQGGLG